MGTLIFLKHFSIFLLYTIHTITMKFATAFSSIALVLAGIASSTMADYCACDAICKEANIPSVIDVATNANFTTLLTAVQTADLVGALGGGDLTIFAPTNEAFAAVPNLSDILDDKELLTQILTYHILPGFVSACRATSLASGAGEDMGVPLQMINQCTATLKKGDAGLMLNDANIIATDVCAANNIVIHAIDKVIVPAESDCAPPPSM